MIFTGKMISGTEAAEIGLADYAVEQNEAGDAAYQRALTLAEEILPRGPVAVKMAKLAINKGIQVSLILVWWLKERCTNTIPPPPRPTSQRSTRTVPPESIHRPFS